MKIAVDARMINHSGIGTTIRAFLSFVQTEKKPLTILDDAKTYPIYSLSQHWTYSRFLNKQNLSLFYMPHFDVPYFYKGPLVIMIHDLIHLKFPHYSTKPLASLYARVVMRKAIQRAKKIIVNSENTEKDVLTFFPEAKGKTKVVYLGVSPEFRPYGEAEVASRLQKFSLSPGYFLYVGNLRGSKNTTGLLKAYTELKTQHLECPPLVLVGKNSIKDEMPRGVIHLGPVSFDDLPFLYSGARLFIFPSFYEGFGLPPLEAMACGTPVVCSEVASLPEVCGEAALYFDPYSKTELKECVVRLWKDSQLQKELREKGFKNCRRFSWVMYAQTIWDILESEAKRP